MGKNLVTCFFTGEINQIFKNRTGILFCRSTAAEGERGAVHRSRSPAPRPQAPPRACSPFLQWRGLRVSHGSLSLLLVLLPQPYLLLSPETWAPQRPRHRGGSGQGRGELEHSKELHGRSSEAWPLRARTLLLYVPCLPGLPLPVCTCARPWTRPPVPVTPGPWAPPFQRDSGPKQSGNRPEATLVLV